MKKILAMGTFACACCALGAMTAKTSWTQRWPWNTKVDIDFTLAGGTKCDVAVTATFTTNGVAGTVDLERAGAKGDFWELEPGIHHLEWDPAAAGLGVAQYSALSVGSYLGNAYGLYDVLGSRVEYVLDRYVDLTTMAAETVDPIGPYGGVYRIIRGQHVQNNHGLRYYALTVINVENIDNLSANTYQSYRFAIHLRPPQSFGGKWK